MLTFTFRSDMRNLDRLEREVPRRVSTAVKRAAEDGAEFLHANWSAISPSDPGNAPAIVTGELDRSVTVDQQGRNLLGQFARSEGVESWSLRVTADHGQYLEPPGWLDRPFFQPAIDFVMSQFDDYFRGIFRL